MGQVSCLLLQAWLFLPWEKPESVKTHRWRLISAAFPPPWWAEQYWHLELCSASSHLHSAQPGPGFRLQIRFFLSPFILWFCNTNLCFGLILVVELKWVEHTATQKWALQIQHEQNLCCIRTEVALLNAWLLRQVLKAIKENEIVSTLTFWVPVSLESL